MSAQMTSQEFNRIRIAFMQRVSAPSIPAVAFKLGWLIAFKYMNCETRVAYPAQETLAADLGTSVRTVQRLLDILERHGLVIVPGDGRGKSSRYWIDPERVTPASPFLAQKGDKKGRHPTPKKGDTHVTRTNKKEPIRKEARARQAQSSPRVSVLPTSSLFPEGWQPADLAPEQQADFDHFADHARAHARTCADWEAAWRNWHRKSVRMQQQERPNGRRHGSVLDACDRLGERLKQAGASDDYVPGSSGPRPLELDQKVRPANLRLISPR
jgi:hypothetical protein